MRMRSGTWLVTLLVLASFVSPPVAAETARPPAPSLDLNTMGAEAQAQAGYFEDTGGDVFSLAENEDKEWSRKKKWLVWGGVAVGIAAIVLIAANSGGGDGGGGSGGY
ncbi:MAG: hypothetical protein HY548_03890 [Elusimicrobia bacterium]|nr:hypothetical protein [Elusimicrobiota bacterium]